MVPAMRQRAYVLRAGTRRAADPGTQGSTFSDATPVVFVVVEALRRTSGRGAGVKASRLQRARVSGARAGEEPAGALPDALL